MKKIVSLLLMLAMVLSFAGVAETTEARTDTLVYATSDFGEKFSPFFSTVAYDTELTEMVFTYLLPSDRGGNVLQNSIEGETVNYNGTDYTYYGLANLDIVMNDDGTVDYNITLRDDVVFSDGTPMTIDDVIFDMYVLSDPTYDGASTFYTLPIEGMDEYYKSMTALGTLIAEAGRDNTDFSKWDEATQTAFWADVDAAGEKFAQEIVDYVVANYADDYASDIEATADEIRADAGLAVKFGMTEWGYGDAWTEGATAADYWKAIEANFGTIFEASDTESAGSALTDFIDDYTAKYGYGVATGDTVKSISGIKKTGDYSMTIHTTEFSTMTIYQLGILVAPLHYYGDPELYNGEDSFGFVKGDLSGVKSKTREPLGSGAYLFKGYENGVVTLEANPLYFEDEPATKNLLMQTAIDSDYVPGIITGTFDIALPSISADTVAAIQDANSNGELTGDTLTTTLIDYRGYGYVGINANLVSVAGEAGSEESKDLRKAFMTLLSVYRDTVVNSYYGDRAAVIQYPISNTSWAAPRPTDEGYENCYSRDVDGNPIYTEGMSDEQKYDAALTAAIGYLKAAGFTWDDAAGKFTAAPEGASLSYEVMIPGQGIGDHPAYGVAVAASEQLAKIGITMQVNDVGTSVWNNALESNTAQIWAAAWQATADPDMYQVYHSSNANGQNTNSNHYQIVSDELDELIMAGRTSPDTDFRKATYKSAMEEILDWGVELPLYQRKDAIVASTIRIDTETLPKDMTPYWGWNAEINTLAVK
ncbi:MAG: ABC transporter substrate-binding protein [Clostridia bacterium]|nr:ABC transporter substrate-binding protein [Clostridia bacterium]